VSQASAQLTKDSGIQSFRPRSSLNGQSVSAIPAPNRAAPDAPPAN
jgi:hypothetical protein